MDSLLQFLSTGPQLNEADMVNITATFREAHKSLNKCLTRVDELRLPALKNMNAGAALSDFLLEEPLIENLPLQPDGTASFLYVMPGDYPLDLSPPAGWFITTDPTVPFGITLESGEVENVTVTLESLTQ